MNPNDTANKIAAHRYIVVVTVDQGSTSRYVIQSDPEHISDHALDLVSTLACKVQYKLLGVGPCGLWAVCKGPTPRTGRGFHTSAQIGSYLDGYSSGTVTDGPIDEDFSWMGAWDAEADIDRAAEARQAMLEARAESRAEDRGEL